MNQATSLNRIFILKNVIQEYAWGSVRAIPELLGISNPEKKPMAEIWMGAHPKAPSMAVTDDGDISIIELIDKDPAFVLGQDAEKFSNKLPYLFKVLAAGEPLSIQAHPNLPQAKEGFAQENTQGIALDAFNRSYKDNNHKPEIICAITPYWALNGFRKADEIVEILDKLNVDALGGLVSILRENPNPAGLKQFFSTMMSMDSEETEKMIEQAVASARKMADTSDIYDWMVKLYGKYPGDVGMLSPGVLNLICLKPFEAMYLPAGQLHAYLDGLGIELMANSDNVLRGGLTPKHVDVPELLKVLEFEEKELEILLPGEISPTEGVYKSDTDEFVFSIIRINADTPHKSSDQRNVEILLCTQGNAKILAPQGELDFPKGTSVLVPAGADAYTIEGEAVICKAAVP